MAKCVITFEDSDEKHGIDIKVEFDPAMDNPLLGHKPTRAQLLGWQFAQSIIETGDGDVDED